MARRLVASFVIPFCNFNNYSPKRQFSFVTTTITMATSTTSTTASSKDDNNSNNNVKKILPTMIVFDLDDCLWTPEMHELYGMPEIPIYGDLTGRGDSGDSGGSSSSNTTIKGVVGLQVPGRRYGGGDTVKLYNGARQVLYELTTNPIYKDILLATASSSLEPDYSYACLNGIEILPRVTIADRMICNQIGRTGRLSPNKITHFTEIHKETGIPYEEMLFFDDCNWGDHCGQVTRELGVVSWRTPQGLQWSDFQQALEKYHQEAQKRRQNK